MKRKLLLLLTCTLLFCFTACGASGNDSSTPDQGQTEDSDKPNDTDPQEDAAKPEETAKPVETAKPGENSEQGNTDQERSLEGLEEYMVSGGYLTGEKIEKLPEMVGAVAGFGYDCGIEIYQYDPSSESYALITNGEDVPLQGMNGYMVHFDAYNGEFALLFSDDNFSQEVVDAFMAY